MKKLLLSLFIFVIIVTSTAYCDGWDVFNLFGSDDSDKKANLDTKELYKQSVGSVVALTVMNSKGGMSGTGFFTLEPDIIATCYHVVAGATSITAKDSGGNEYKIEGIIDYSEKLDIAILKSSKQGKTLALDANMPSPGTNVYALGNPMGLNFSFTNGMVSQIQNLDGTNIIQFTAPVSPGNSGGPLLSENGKVLGIVSAYFTKGQNLNFAVPVAMLQTLNKTKKSLFFDNSENIQNSTTKSNSGNKEKYNKHYRLASDLYYKELYELAIEEYLKALEYASKSEDLVDIIERLSSIYYYDLKKNKESKFWAEKGLKIAIENDFQGFDVRELYIILAHIYFNEENYSQSIKMNSQAINMNELSFRINDFLKSFTSNEILYYNIGASYYNLGNKYYNKGNKKEAKNNYLQAIINYKKSIELDENCYDAYIAIENSYQNLGDTQNAKKWHNMALKLRNKKEDNNETKNNKGNKENKKSEKPKSETNTSSTKKTQETNKTTNNNQNPKKKIDFKQIYDQIMNDMVKCPAGSFMMGSPENELGRGDDETQHKVIFSKPFYIGKYEVTRNLYKTIMDENSSDSKEINEPIVYVNWNDAKNFCEKLNSIFKNYIPKGFKFDLPTEAQWEYACRAGTTTSLNSGKNITEILCSNADEVAWYGQITNEKAHPVGQKMPNAWGIYDMHGNVAEWCNDWYGYFGLSATDPLGADKKTKGDSYKVCRGGHCNDKAFNCRSAYRNAYTPYSKYDNVGFRIALVQIEVLNKENKSKSSNSNDNNTKINKPQKTNDKNNKLKSNNNGIEQNKNNELLDFYKEMQELLNKDDYEKMYQKAHQLEHKYPDDFYVLFYVGMSAKNIGKLYESLDYYQNRLYNKKEKYNNELNQNNMLPVILVQIGTVYRYLNQFNIAIDFYEKALNNSNGTGDALIHGALAEVYYNMRKKGKAMFHAIKAKNLNNDPNIEYQLDELIENIRGL